MPKSRKRRKASVVRSKASKRADLVLAIVETDVTFEKHPNKDMHHGLDVWVGKCIHCNRKLVVTYCGTTDATIEHVMPLCNDGQAQDVRNLALACKGCNNEKGIRHDRHAGRGGRADEVITALQNKRMSRWREPDVT